MQSVRVLARRLVSRTSNGNSTLTSTARLSTKSGSREEELLAKDPALSKYQSTKTTVQRIQLFGDFLVLLVAAGAVYEIAYKVQQRNAAEAQDVKQNIESQNIVEQRTEVIKAMWKSLSVPDIELQGLQEDVGMLEERKALVLG
ncbi:unnamed protein product [Sphagnum jensenii]|uniref:OPA3-like protein n=1 Tax=Sphagnum jensenii TaxID=128206 RepID=A0ABP0VBV5_9BRYO